MNLHVVVARARGPELPGDGRFAVTLHAGMWTAGGLWDEARAVPVAKTRAWRPRGANRIEKAPFAVTRNRTGRTLEVFQIFLGYRQTDRTRCATAPTATATV